MLLPLVPDIKQIMGTSLVRTNEANMKLVALEKQALEFARKGKRPQAKRLLASRTYETLKGNLWLQEWNNFRFHLKNLAKASFITRINVHSG